MQIHELNNFAGTPSSTDYLAIDNSTTTTKIGATGLGVQDKLTVAEANTGTSTASRIVTPKVVHDYVTGEVSDGIDNITTSATETKWANITGGDGSINDALNYSADALKPVKTTFTPTSGTAYANYGGCYYVVYGKFVHVHVGLSGLTANSGVTIYTLPEEIRIADGTVFGYGTGGTSTSTSKVEVRNTGVIYVTSTATYAGVDAYYILT